MGEAQFGEDGMVGGYVLECSIEVFLCIRVISFEGGGACEGKWGVGLTAIDYLEWGETCGCVRCSVVTEFGEWKV